MKYLIFSKEKCYALIYLITFLIEKIFTVLNLLLLECKVFKYFLNYQN